MTLLELARQYKSDVETRIECIKNESDMGIKEASSEEIAHWEATLKIINQTIKKHEVQRIHNWVVIVGRPVFSCQTRSGARIFAKKQCSKDVDKINGKFVYVGKCIKGYCEIVLET